MLRREAARVWMDGHEWIDLAGRTVMTRAAEAEREAKIAELKRLITAGKYETLEKLEDAVDAFLWGQEDEQHAAGAAQHPAQPR